MSYNEPPPPAYGGQPGYGAQPQSNSVMAIISLVTGILGVTICCGSVILSVAAIILGQLAKKEINESGGAKKGGGMAQAGFILGIVGTIIGVIYLILVFSGSINFYYSDM